MNDTWWERERRKEGGKSREKVKEERRKGRKESFGRTICRGRPVNLVHPDGSLES